MGLGCCPVLHFGVGGAAGRQPDALLAPSSERRESLTAASNTAFIEIFISMKGIAYRAADYEIFGIENLIISSHRVLDAPSVL